MRAPWLADDLPHLQLPVLAPPYPTVESRAWFRVPGMYGGFRYWFDRLGSDARLIAESFCRIAHGWAQRHGITAAGSELLAREHVWFEPRDGTGHLPPGQRHYIIRTEFRDVSRRI